MRSNAEIRGANWRAAAEVAQMTTMTSRSVLQGCWRGARSALRRASPVAAVVGDGANLKRGATETQASAGRIAGSGASLEPIPRPSQTSGRSGTAGPEPAAGNSMTPRQRHRRALPEQARSRKDSYPFATSVEQLGGADRTDTAKSADAEISPSTRGEDTPRRSGITNELPRNTHQACNCAKTIHQVRANDPTASKPV